MKQILKIGVLLFLLVLGHWSSYAAGIKFTASIQKNPVTVGELFQVSYTIENGNVQKFINPTFTSINI